MRRNIRRFVVTAALVATMLIAAASIALACIPYPGAATTMTCSLQYSATHSVTTCNAVNYARDQL